MLRDFYRQKKHFLEEFLKITNDGIVCFSLGNVDGIDDFYLKRESIIEILRQLDDKISLAEKNFNENRSLALKTEIKQLRMDIQEITQNILSKDLVVLDLIKKAKSEINTHLQSLKKNKKVVSSYKTKVDRHQLDEEV